MRALLHRGVPNKYVNIIQALYAKTYGCVRAYGELSKEFTTRSGVRQGCPLSPFLFNFVMDEIMEDCLRHTSSSGVDILPGDKLSDLDYADDKVLLFDNFSDAQMLLDRIVLSSAPFGMQFAPLKLQGARTRF